MHARNSRIQRELERQEPPSKFSIVKVEEVFDLQKLTNLKRLRIDYCESINEIIGLDSLVALKYFYLPRSEWEYCEIGGLRSLPRISELKNLQKLDISYQSIAALEGLSDAISLQVLNASHCYERRELPDMAKLTNLRDLDISWSCVQAIPGLGELVSLRELGAQHCLELGELPDMSKLTKLVELNISWCCVQAIRGLGKLVSLEELAVQHCSKLSDMPDLQKLSNLLTLDLRWCALKTVRGLDTLESLERLNVHHCSELVALPELCKLTNLCWLDVRHCSSLKSLPSVENLSYLWQLKGDWQTLSKVHKLPQRLTNFNVVGWSSQGLAGLACSANLRRLTISDCRELDELNSLSELPDVTWLTFKRCNFRVVPGLMNCTALQYLEIISSGELERLPGLRHLKSLKIVGKENSEVKTVLLMGNFPKLRELEYRNLEILELPDLSSYCPQQITLRVSNCGEFRRYASNGPLTWLGSLIVQNCESLRELPDLSFCTNLYSLEVISCGRLRELPDLGKCTQLRELTVESCGSVRALPTMEKCTELYKLDVRSCGSVREVPDLGLCTKLEDIVVSNCSDYLTRPKPSDCEESKWPYLEWKLAP